MAERLPGLIDPNLPADQQPLLDTSNPNPVSHPPLPLHPDRFTPGDADNRIQTRPPAATGAASETGHAVPRGTKTSACIGFQRQAALPARQRSQAGRRRSLPPRRRRAAQRGILDVSAHRQLPPGSGDPPLSAPSTWRPRCWRWYCRRCCRGGGALWLLRSAPGDHRLLCAGAAQPHSGHVHGRLHGHFRRRPDRPRHRDQRHRQDASPGTWQLRSAFASTCRIRSSG